MVVQYDLGATDSAHKAILGAVAGPLMNRLATLPPDQWPALLAALNDLCRASPPAYFNNASVETEIDQVGWSGTLNPVGARDYMMEIESNLGGTKAKYFVVRHFAVELTRIGSKLHHQVVIDLTDNMPFSYRPNEFYHAYLRLYLSDSASFTFNNLKAVRYPDPPPPAGTRLTDGWLPLFHGYGHSARAVFNYDTPWVANGRGEDQIYWQKQPGTLSDKVGIVWHDGSGHTYAISGDLGQDRVIRFSSRGLSFAAVHLGQAELPSLGLG